MVIVLGRVLNSSLGLVDNGKIFKISFLIVCYIHQRVWLFVQIQITIQDSKIKRFKNKATNSGIFFTFLNIVAFFNIFVNLISMSEYNLMWIQTKIWI